MYVLYNKHKQLIQKTHRYFQKKYFKQLRPFEPLNVTVCLLVAIETKCKNYYLLQIILRFSGTFERMPICSVIGWEFQSSVTKWFVLKQRKEECMTLCGLNIVIMRICIKNVRTVFRGQRVNKNNRILL